MREAIPDVGYLHRAIEHIAEKCTYEGFMPYTDRVDYVCAMSANHVWALAVEKLAELEVPERAEYLRVISDELNRIASHCIALGAMAMDIGAITPFTYILREREYVNELLEMLCGARLTYNYHRIGGVGWDMPTGWRDKVLLWCDHFEPVIDEFDRLITNNELFVKRLANLAVISADEAMSYGLVGPNLRASGVDFDVRRDVPYSIYPKLKFDVPVGRGLDGHRRRLLGSLLGARAGVAAVGGDGAAVPGADRRDRAGLLEAAEEAEAQGRRHGARRSGARRHELLRRRRRRRPTRIGRASAPAASTPWGSSARSRAG